MTAPRATGIVLAGGKGERMGAFKPLLMFRGRPLIAYAIDALAPLCDEILVMAGPQHGAILSRVVNENRGAPSELRDLSAPPRLRGERPALARVLADPGAGPHVALALAARIAQGDALLVAPADAPFLTRAVFDALLAGAPNAVAREGAVRRRRSAEDEDAPQRVAGVNPLVACYRRADLLAATAAPVRSLQDVAARLGAVAVDVGARLLADVDTREDLGAAERGA